MKTVRLSQENTVSEIIPEYAMPPEQWYGLEFARMCVEAPDETDIGWVYDPSAGIFSAPPPPAPSLTDQLRTVERRLLEIRNREWLDEICAIPPISSVTMGFAEKDILIQRRVAILQALAETEAAT